MRGGEAPGCVGLGWFWLSDGVSSCLGDRSIDTDQIRIRRRRGARIACMRVRISPPPHRHPRGEPPATDHRRLSATSGAGLDTVVVQLNATSAQQIGLIPSPSQRNCWSVARVVDAMRAICVIARRRLLGRLDLDQIESADERIQADPHAACDGGGRLGILLWQASVMRNGSTARASRTLIHLVVKQHLTTINPPSPFSI